MITGLVVLRVPALFAARSAISPSRRSRFGLYKQLSARHWRIVEPEPIALEEPRLWPDVIRVHREVHGYDDSELAAIAHVHVQLLADLLPEFFRVRPRLRAVTASDARASQRPG